MVRPWNPAHGLEGGFFLLHSWLRCWRLAPIARVAVQKLGCSQQQAWKPVSSAELHLMFTLVISFLVRCPDVGLGLATVSCSLSVGRHVGLGWESPEVFYKSFKMHHLIKCVHFLIVITLITVLCWTPWYFLSLSLSLSPVLWCISINKHANFTLSSMHFPTVTALHKFARIALGKRPEGRKTAHPLQCLSGKWSCWKKQPRAFGANSARGPSASVRPGPCVPSGAPAAYKIMSQVTQTSELTLLITPE